MLRSTKAGQPIFLNRISIQIFKTAPRNCPKKDCSYYYYFEIYLLEFLEFSPFQNWKLAKLVNNFIFARNQIFILLGMKPKSIFETYPTHRPESANFEISNVHRITHEFSFDPSSESLNIHFEGLLTGKKSVGIIRDQLTGSFRPRLPSASAC